MTRIAISPRLATSRLWRGIGPQGTTSTRRPLNPAPGTADFSYVDVLVTPFRQRYERSLSLELGAQIEECADYLQNPEVLIAEFLESYYWIEGKLDPEREDELLAASQAELVLEPYFDSLELRVQVDGRVDSIRCLAGAFAPLPGELHPALEQKGVDYVGVREGSQRVVFGVTDLQQASTSFCLLLRGLNCLAE